MALAHRRKRSLSRGLKNFFRASAARQRRTRKPSVRPPFGLEPLEPRVLLSVDLMPAAEMALKQGLPGLSQWADQEVEQLDAFKQTLPLFQESFGSLADISKILQDNIAQHVVDYLNTAGTHTSQGLADSLRPFLQALDASNDITDLSDASGILFDVTFHYDATGSVEISLGDNPFGLSVENGSPIDATVSLDFDFKFGVDLTPGLAPSEAFFIEVPMGGPAPALSAGVTLDVEDADNLSLGIMVGMLQTTGDVVNLDAHATLEASLMDPNGDGRLTRAEFEGTPIESIVALTPGPTSGLENAAVDATIDLAASLGTYNAMGQILVKDENLFDSEALDIDFTAPQDLQDFANITPGDLASFLNELGASLQGVSAALNPEAGIPLLDLDLNQLANFKDLMGDLAGGMFDIELSGFSSYTAPSAFAGSLSDKAVISLLRVVSIAGNGAQSTLAEATNLMLTQADINAAAGGTAIAKAANALQTKINATALNGHVTVGQDGTFITLATDASDRLVVVYEGDDRGMKDLGFTPRLSDAVFRFDSIQDFVELLKNEIREVFPAFEPNVDYDTGSELTFDLHWEMAFARTVPLQFNEEFELPGGFGSVVIIGGATASLNTKASFQARVGIDLSPLGGGFTAENSTTLAGLGVEPLPGEDDLVFLLRDGSTFNVNLDLVPDLGGLIAEIEGMSGFLMDGITHKVTVSLIPDDPATLANEQVGLKLVDNTNGTHTFTITAFRGSGGLTSLAGLQLGILGSDVDGDRTIVGTPLHDDRILDHAFVQDGASLSAELTLSADTIYLTATLGFLEAGIVNGVAGFKVTGGMELDDPGGSGRILLSELIQGAERAEILGAPGATDGKLTGDAMFSIDVNGHGAVMVTVHLADTMDNTSLADLAEDLNAALATTSFTSPAYDSTPFAGKHLGDFLHALVKDGRLSLGGSVQSLAISATNMQAQDELGFQDGDMATAVVLMPSVAVMGTVDAGDPDLAARLPIMVPGLGNFELEPAPAAIVGDSVPAAGTLDVDATFAIDVNGGGPIMVTVTAASTSGNMRLADLVDNLNAALALAAFAGDGYEGTPFEGKHLGDFITASVEGMAIKLFGDVQSLAISATNAETNTKLGFEDGDSGMAADFRVELTIATGSPIDLTPGIIGADAATLEGLLAPFKDFSLATLLQLADQIVMFIKSDDLGIFSQKFPLVDLSVRDMVGFLSDIESAIDEVKGSITGLRESLLGSDGTAGKLDELMSDGGLLQAAVAALAAAGQTERSDKLLAAFDALVSQAHALPDTLGDALDFPKAPALVAAMVALRDALRDIDQNTSVNVDDLKKEIAILQNSIPSADAAAKFLFNLVGLDALGAFNLESLFDQKAALQSAVDALKATDDASDAIKDTFRQIAKDLGGALVERLAGGGSFTDSDVSDWDPSALLKVIGKLRQAIDDLNTEIAGIGDPADDNEEAARDQLQSVLDALNAALPAGLMIEFLDSGGDQGIVFRLHYSRELLDESFKLDFEIPDAGSFIPFQVKSDGEFNIDLAMALDIGFGLNFSDLSNIADAFFLTGDSSLQVTALVENASLSAEVSIGGITAGLSGMLKVQADVDDGVDDDPAILKVTLGGMATDRVLLGDIGTSLDLSESMGELKANVDAMVAGATVNDAIVVTADLTDFDPVDIQLNLDLSLAQLDLTGIVQMLETFLGFLAEGLKSELMSKLPLVGKDFSEAGTFIQQIRDQIASIRSRLESEINPEELDPTVIEGQIHDILDQTLGTATLSSSKAGGAPGLAGLGLITITEVTVDLPNGGNLITDPDAAVTVRFQIGADDLVGAGFDAKLPALGLLSGDVGVQIGLLSTIDFGVRVTKTGGPVLLLNADDTVPEVNFGITVNVMPDIKLDLFFLELSITDHTPDPEIDFMAGINLSYGGAAEVPILDVDLSSFTFDPSFMAEVHLDLHLTASTKVKNLPKLEANFLLDWEFDIDDASNLDNLTYVAFEDISLNLGDLLAGPIGQIFDSLDRFLEPVRPLIEFMNAEIPLISQVSQLVGQGPFTFLDGIRLLGEGGETIATVVEILDSIADAVAAVQVDPSNPIFTVNFGDYVLVDNRPAKLKTSSNLDLFGEGTDLTGALDTNYAKDAGYDSSYAMDSGGLFSTLGQEGGQGMLGIAFPLIQDPKQIINLLFGKTVDLVVWDVPRLEASFGFAQLFGPIIPPFPVFARLAGSFGIFADFLVGLDTRGIQTGNFINGLYFGDRTPTTAKGEDVPELGLTLEFTAGAELSIPFAKAGVEGGVRASIFANWNDVKEDGKFYLDELLSRAAQGPECIFDLEGALQAFLRAYLNIEIPLGITSITIIDVDFTILEVTLFEFSHSCPPLPPPIPAHLSNGGSGAGDPDTWNGPTTDLLNGTTITHDATTFPSGTLVLHSGSFSDLRQSGASDIADDIKIRGEGEFDGKDGFAPSSYHGSTDEFDSGQVSASQGNGVVVDVEEDEKGVAGDIVRDDLNNDGMNTPDVILVEAFGVTHVYTGVQAIIVDLGDNDEDDTILIDPSVRVPVTVIAGGGDDEVQGGSGNDVILGGPGQDKITGGRGNDFIAGGDDNDEIFGNAGADTIRGGGGDDTIYGGDNDHKDVDDLADDIEGGAGNDRLYGALGSDTIRGQAGSDQIHGGAGADELHGGPDDDQIFGDEDSDFGAPSDGTGEGDFMVGGPGNDQLYGGLGDDRMVGGGIFGSTDGGDLMVGGPGDDRMLGDNGDIDGTGSFTIQGGAGFDTMIGGDGNDVMYGQGGDDTLYGDGSVDQTAGTIDANAGAGMDYMEGNADSDTLYGGALDDRMIGGSSSLPATGFDSGDLMFGGEGSDIMLGDNGTITGATGNVATNANGGSGNDRMFGGGGDDVLFGGGRSDSLSGSSGNDVLVGDQGTRTSTMITADHSVVANSSGDDTLSGSTGQDTLLGGEGDDEIAGDAQVDIAIGDDGQVTLTGGVPTQIETKDFGFGGNDTITGSTAPDILLGGSGADLITGGGDVADDIILGDNGVVRDNNAAPGANNDIWSNDPAGAADMLDGGPGNDIMLGGTAGDTMFGGEGDDLLLGDHGNVERNAAEAVRFIETVAGAFKGKNFSGAGGADVISGEGGTDVALGGQAGDTIYGDAAMPGGSDGRDILLGDNGEITLVDPLGPGAGAGPDAIVTFNGAVASLHSTDLTSAEGGSDTVTGNAGDDILAGGVLADLLHGNEGHDIALGDNARLEWLYAGGDPAYAALEGGFAFDATFTTLDLIATRLPAAHPGGRDLIFGDAGNDVLMGGEDADTVWGDDGDSAGIATANDDILFGDHGIVYPHHSALPDFPSRNYFSIDRGDGDAGEGDRLFGEEGDDLLMGQQGDDRLFGGDDDDDLIGGHNVAGGIDELSAGAIASSVNPPVNDIMDGGAGDDALAGDNAAIWRKAEGTSPRFRALTGQTLYDPLAGPNGQAQVTGISQLDPRGSVGRDITLLDHTAALQALLGARPWGSDIMAGGSRHDMLFGELGNDVMQGDGSIDPAEDGLPGPSPMLTTTDSGAPSTAGMLFFNVAESALDGDDYLEGNGGADLMYGNLGQDDLIGGSSSLFGLSTGNMRPDGVDIIYGGAGTPSRIARNAATPDADPLVAPVDRHAVDADAILGDNANIYRIVGTGGVDSGDFLAFNYDALDPARGAEHIVPRAVDLIDYIRGAGDTGENGVAHGAGDLIHGESGDDLIHGMIGGDVLYGESEDDTLYGEAGNDWISGGTGQDGILGDDGFIFTSRNGNPGEPLHGVATLAPADLDKLIRTPGGIQQAVINVSGQLKNSVNLEPFLVGGDDILYGGLGDDMLHGGGGDDAISGAEALPVSAAQIGGARVTFLYDNPSNPGNALDFERYRPDEFALYDEFDPLRRIQLDANGDLVKNNAQPGPYQEFLLNFEAFTNAGDQVGTMIHDGNDVLFGDEGNDWLVGGTDQDHLYGGFGADLMNLDDNLATNGGLNDVPDVPAFIGTSTLPGQPGADTAFGGGGRDILIANSGADRMIDWIGEYNSYLVPFAAFGEFTVSRSLLPQLPQYLYDLSRSDGADQTRSADTGSAAARNGEPNGELGLVLQQDPQWQAQTGAPDDPQAGNTPGGKKDVMQASDFSSGQSGPMAVVAGQWSVANGQYGSAAAGDAVSLFYLDDPLPRHAMLMSVVNLDRPSGDAWARGYLVFDYQSPTDFKFAGLSADQKQIQIGQRTSTGWEVLASAATALKYNRDYELSLSLDGGLATLKVDNVGTIAHTFDRGFDGGMLGVAADRSVSRFDDLKAIRLSNPIAFTLTEDLSDGVADRYLSRSGSWIVSGDAYVGSPSSADPAISTLSLDVAPWSYLEFQATVRPAATAGFVFDSTSPTEFKFAVLDAGSGRMVIGHRTAHGWFEDAALTRGIQAGTEHSLLLALDGLKATLTLDGTAVLEQVYNSLLNDGDLGLLGLGGSARFDDMTARGDDAHFTSGPFGRLVLEPSSTTDPAPADTTTGPDATDAGTASTGLIEARLLSRWDGTGSLSGSGDSSGLRDREDDAPVSTVESGVSILWDQARRTESAPLQDSADDGWIVDI